MGTNTTWDSYRRTINGNVMMVRCSIHKRENASENTTAACSTLMGHVLSARNAGHPVWHCCPLKAVPLGPQRVLESGSWCQVETITKNHLPVGRSRPRLLVSGPTTAYITRTCIRRKRGRVANEGRLTYSNLAFAVSSARETRPSCREGSSRTPGGRG